MGCWRNGPTEHVQCGAVRLGTAVASDVILTVVAGVITVAVVF